MKNRREQSLTSGLWFPAFVAFTPFPTFPPPVSASRAGMLPVVASLLFAMSLVQAAGSGETLEGGGGAGFCRIAARASA